jgi:cobalamin 5'-phosphate synthase/cobalamin synthase
MRRLLAGIAFLSRLPVPSGSSFDAADVGKATLLFPLIGALLGGIQALAAITTGARLPALLAATLLVALSAILTGALHLDGLADMADGFGGGKTREDVLRIMRDHSIGAYGGVALILVIAVKITAIACLVTSVDGWRILIVAAAVARWGSVPLGRLLPYARREDGGLGKAITDHVGPAELVGSTVIAGAIAFGLCGFRLGAILWAGAAIMTWLIGRMCKDRIGGITGDTMGANTELCEALVYVLAVAAG